MPIAALPLNTVLAIGSTQVLSDSSSLVKELVENALDARASAIFVEISENALDVIQVKDNGHGIAPNDRNLVGRRYCTSKISGFDDLTNIGGLSLGFRGEALASAIELSEGMTLTTKVEGEQVAASIKFNRKGEIVSQQAISHPVGTTVRVVDFLKSLPVRRQTALKFFVRMISKIKEILEAYALARPSVRFSLKVLKSKNDKGNWTYAPNVGASVMDAAMKILDLQAVMQCKWYVWPSPEVPKQASLGIDGVDDINTDSTGFSIEALLPRPQSDISAISHIGQHISIDSRPMSCNRGTLKQIISLYKSYVRSGSFQPKNKDKVVNPILCLNIVCPLGSYDANVEPAKDDVLFTHPGILLDVVESFFKNVYGELSDAASRRVESAQQRPNHQGFELLLNRKPLSLLDGRAVLESGNEAGGKEAPSNASNSLDSRNPTLSARVASPPAAGMPANTTQHIGSAQHKESSSSERGSTWIPNMYEIDDDMDRAIRDSGDLDSTQRSDSDEEEQSRDVHVSNPWTMAKMNAPIHHQPHQQPLTNAAQYNGQLLTPARQRGEYRQTDSFPRVNVGSDTTHNTSVLPSPGDTQAEAYYDEQHSPSQDRFDFPIRAWGPGNRPKRSTTQVEPAVERPVEGALDSWVRKNPVRSDGFVSARTLPAGTPLDAIPEISQRPRKPQQKQANVGKTFQSPVNDPHCIWFDFAKPRKTNTSLRPSPQTNLKNISITAPIHRSGEDEPSSPDETLVASNLPQPIHPDLAITLDYEARKQAAMQRRKEFIRKQARETAIEATTITHPSILPNPIISSPHKNRYNSAIAALTSSTPAPTTTTNTPSPFPPNDPRAYLLQLHNTSEPEPANTSTSNPNPQSRKLKRHNTSLLPLETIPTDTYTGDLIFSLPATTAQQIGQALRKIAEYDNYIRVGTETETSGTGMRGVTSAEAQIWTSTLRELVLRGYRTVDDKEGDVLLNLENVLRRHELADTEG